MSELPPLSSLRSLPHRSASLDLSTRLYSLVTSSKPNFSEALALLRKSELEEGELSERHTVVKKGRCPVCTLALPCAHFGSLKKAKKSIGRHMSDTPVPPHVASPAPTDAYERMSPPSMRVRFRSPHEVTYSTKSQSLSPKRARRLELRRIRILEKLDAYHNRRCQQEIQKIEEYKQREEAARQEELSKEQKRLKRDEQLKEELRRYHDATIKLKQTKQEEALQEMKEQRIKERRRLRYLRKQVRFT